jgi:ParB-like chromosome segregation protein Spo0J
MSELKFHPIADIFPLMEGADFDALVADIKANGLNEDIVLYDGMILDGRNRYRACLAAGWYPAQIDQRLLVGDSMLDADRWIDDPAAYVISANIHRRHLTAEDKRVIIAKLLEAQPEKSDRQIAGTVKTDHKTVGTVRAELEGRGEIPHVEARTDTKGRKQPAKKAKAKRNERLAERRQQHAAAEQRRREHAGAIAQELIQEFGEMAVRRIADALRIAYVEEALSELLGKGTTPTAATGAADGLDIPESAS